VKWIKTLLGLGVLIIVVSYLVAFFSVLAVSRQDQARRCRPSSSSAPRNTTASRARCSRRGSTMRPALRDSVAPLIVLTGAWPPAIRPARRRRGGLPEQGGPEPRAGWCFPAGRATDESIVAAAEWCRGYGITEVVVVSDPFHMLRVRLEASRQGLTAWTSPTRTSPVSTRLARELPYLMAGGAQGARAGRRGGVSPTQVPDPQIEVRDADAHQHEREGAAP